MILKQTEIKNIIPHREPFLLIDEVLELSQDKVVAIKHIDPDAAYLQGHFPDFPIMPGVLIIEAMAQAGAVCVLGRPEFQGRLAFFAGIDKVRFKRKVRPGDLLRLEVVLTRLRGPVGFATGQALVDGELAAAAELIFAIGDK